jgi:hypothetical protein
VLHAKYAYAETNTVHTLMRYWELLRRPNPSATPKPVISPDRREEAKDEAADLDPAAEQMRVRTPANRDADR